jgi:hypothetical protein
MCVFFLFFFPLFCCPFFLFLNSQQNYQKITGKIKKKGLIGLLSSAGVGADHAAGPHHHGHPRHHLPPLGDLVSLGLVNPTSG